MGRAVAASGDHTNRAPRASACEPYRELIVEAIDEAVGAGTGEQAAGRLGYGAGRAFLGYAVG